MELPTYTSIWRIEKRLYKLYDFRLPMPLPVGLVAVRPRVSRRISGPEAPEA